MSDYSDKLKDPRWQKRRLEILERDKWECQRCLDNESTLVVHHRLYLPDKEPWEYPDNLLVTLCKSCHESELKERPTYEKDLIDILKIKFLYWDIFILKEAFAQIKQAETIDFTTHVLKWILSSPDKMHELEREYWENVIVKQPLLARIK